MKNIILFLFICLCSCQATAPHEKEGDKLISRFIAQAYRSHDLRLLGSGGAFLDDIKKFNFLFYTTRPIDNIAEARIFIVNVIEELLVSINSDADLQPYLHQTPFDYHNVEVGILFFTPDGENFLEPPYLASVYINVSGLHYRLFDPIKDTLVTLSDEPYPEAKQIVEQQASP